MRNITSVLGAFLTLFIISCDGSEGPPGYDGLDGRDGTNGQDGVTVLSKVMEIEGDFTNANDYTISYEFPQTVEVFESDLVLVYMLFDQTTDANGESVDIWRLLPQTRILDQGLLQYNYDHTFFDVNIFLESNFDMGTLLAGDTDNQIFRIAVVPGEFAQNSKMDRHNLEAVMQQLEVTEQDIVRVRAK